MHTQKQLFTLILFCLGQICFAQISGNHVFSDNGYSNSHSSREKSPRQNQTFKLHLNDSSFLIQAKVLKNVKADGYVAVFGLNQEDQTVIGCNGKINNKIKRFVDNINKMGIKDIYTDLLTQNRVYDFHKHNVYNYFEYVKGYELSKNVIVKYTKPEQIEELLTLASKDSIFDLVKVDYIIEDIAKVYDELFEEAKGILAKKKQKYVDLTNAKLKPSAQIYAEGFESFFPSGSYKSYKAFSQNFYEYSWSSDKTVKRLHKFQTFYYDPIGYSGFDKIINPAILEPPIEVVLTLQIKYEIQN